MIASFQGEYRWLSNFWYCTIDGRYTTIEHLYQASKTLNKDEQKKILNASTPAIAKRLGRYVTLRSDWNEIKIKVMTQLVTKKFKQNLDLQKKLLATGSEQLIEGNGWGDTFWGVCNGRGANHLGEILMEVRASIINEKEDRDMEDFRKRMRKSEQLGKSAITANSGDRDRPLFKRSNV